MKINSLLQTRIDVNKNIFLDKRKLHTNFLIVGRDGG